MNKRLIVMTHLVTLGVGFLLGIYALPILVAPDGPSDAELGGAMARASFTGEFRRDLKGSDFLHWGEGSVAVGPDAVALSGRLAPGPDYRLYLAPRFVDDKESFQRVKGDSVEVGMVNTFENFLLPLSPSVDLEQFDTVVVWCEAFSQFITSARYR
jgi:hypothetical protein